MPATLRASWSFHPPVRTRSPFPASVRAGFGSLIRFCGFWGGTEDFGKVARSCFGSPSGPGWCWSGH